MNTVDHPDCENDPNLWQPFARWLHRFFCNQKSTPMAQIIFTFTWGVLLSPFNAGLFILMFFIVLNEIFFYIFTHGDQAYYDLFVRTAVIFTGIFGYILGRTLSDIEVTEDGVPAMPGSHSQ